MSFIIHFCLIFFPRVTNKEKKWCWSYCWRASSNHNLDSSISSGLNLNIKTQNSIWLRVPSPSKSPSISIDWRSSSLKPCNPNKAEFFFRLSKVMTPLSESFKRLNPLHSSSIRPSPPSLLAMKGRSSWKWDCWFCDVIVKELKQERESTEVERWIRNCKEGN